MGTLKTATDVKIRNEDGMRVVEFDSGLVISSYDITSTWLIQSLAGEVGGRMADNRMQGMKSSTIKMGQMLTALGDPQAYVQSYDLFRFFNYMETGGTADDPGPVDLDNAESLANATDYLLDNITLMLMSAVL